MACPTAIRMTHSSLTPRRYFLQYSQLRYNLLLPETVEQRRMVASSGSERQNCLPPFNRVISPLHPGTSLRRPFSTLLPQRGCFHHRRGEISNLSFSTLSSVSLQQQRLHQRLHAEKFLDADGMNLILSLQTRLKSKDRGKSGKGGKGSKSGGRIRFDDSFAQVVNHLQFQSEIDEAFNGLADDLAAHCTVKSGAGVFDRLEVSTGDGPFSLNELGTIHQKSSSLVTVNMSSLPNYIPDVIAAVLNSNLNVNPQQEGANILLSLPKVTKEHRVRLAAEAKKRLESMKVESRHIFAKHSRVAKDKKNNVGNSGFSEDLILVVEMWLKQEMDETIHKAEALVKEKQEEVLDASRS